jgi:prolyl-tRNA editing enzyme YbaK/EbsC (Cys-tRNA(Pro) deacylase)
MGLSKNAQKIQDALKERGLQLAVIELDTSTRTAQDAANAVGCQIGQIVKSLVFRSGDDALLFLVSGQNQLNVARVSAELGIPIKKADADFAHQKSGYPIGGVPPLAHEEPMHTYIDRDLMVFDEVWAAAGTPHAVFKLESRLLPEVTGGLILDLT